MHRSRDRHGLIVHQCRRRGPVMLALGGYRSNMKSILLTLLLLCLLAGAAFAQQALPRFEDYQVPVYHGATRPPKWARHIDGVWRDNLNKLVEPPQVNFAGKYCIAVHSCGTGCRYYTLTDLSSGRDLKVLDRFAAAEPPPKTRDGHLNWPIDSGN